MSDDNENIEQTIVYYSSINASTTKYFFEKKITNSKQHVLIISLVLDKHSKYQLTNKCGYYITTGVNKGLSGNMYTIHEISYVDKHFENRQIVSTSISDVPSIEFYVKINENQVDIWITCSKLNSIYTSGVLELVNDIPLLNHNY